MKRLFLSVITVLAIAMGAIAVDGLNDDVQVSDVAVVLGSKVMPNGRPSARLQARLDKAAELYRRGQFRRIIVSGGTGVEGFSEAKVMAAYLMDRHAVPAAALLLDEQGNTTEDTARNSAELMRAQHLQSALVVTQFFHIPRSRYALHRAGVLTVHTAHADYFELRDLYSITRELMAMPAYWLGFR